MLELKDILRPQPGEGELLVRMKISVLNRAKHFLLTASDYLSDAVPDSVFKGENRGWHKPLTTLQNLRQPLSIIREFDND